MKFVFFFFFKKACSLQDMVLTQVFKSCCLFGLSFSGTGPSHFKIHGHINPQQPNKVRIIIVLPMSKLSLKKATSRANGLQLGGSKAPR